MVSRGSSPTKKLPILISAILMALAFSSVTAGAAQALDWATAESGAPYVLSGASSKSTAGSASFVLSGTVLGSNLEVACNASTTNGSITAGGKGSATIALSGCEADPPQCKLSPVSLAATTELIQVGVTTYEKFVPAKGANFGELEFTGAGCVFAELGIPVSGTLAGLPPQSERTVNRQLTISPSTNSAAGVQVKMAGKTALFAGNITEHLSSAPAGSSWRSVWEGTHGGWEIQEINPQALKTSESVQFSGAPMELGFNYGGTTISINCSGASAKEATLVPGGTETVKQLALTGCTVTKPSTCSLERNTVEFTPLTGSLSSVGGSYYETFKPTEAGGVLSALNFTGSCYLAGYSYPVKGSFAGLGYGLPAVSQPLAFSKASNEAAGANLSMGSGSSGWLSGTVNQKFTGVNTGRPWEVL